MPVAAEVARALGAPLDVILVRKLGVPAQPELAMGALGEEGVRVVDQSIVDARPACSDEQLAEVEARERDELERRARAYRGDRDPLPIAGRTVLIVDDGLATGATARAAIEVARAAAPAGSSSRSRSPHRRPSPRCAGRGRRVISVETPAALAAIGQWYDDFSQTSDAEVVAHLEGPAR